VKKFLAFVLVVMFFIVTAALYLRSSPESYTLRDTNYNPPTVNEVQHQIEGFHIVYFNPPDGSDDVPINTPILFKIEFSEPPNDDFEDWIRIVPSVRGEFSLHGNIILFSSSRPLIRNSQYNVFIQAGLTSAAGEPIPAPFSFTFRASGHQNEVEVIDSGNSYYVHIYKL